MNRNFRTVILLLTFLLYQVEALHGISQSKDTFFLFHGKSGNDQPFFTIISANLFCLPWKSDDSNGQKTASATATTPGPAINIDVSWNFDNHFIKNYIEKYISDFSKVLIHCRKMDLIFPFQYFW